MSVSKLSLKVRLTKFNASNVDDTKGLTVRILSEWTNCLTTGIYGEANLSWQQIENSIVNTDDSDANHLDNITSSIETAVYETDLDIALADTLEKFNRNPIITAVLLQQQHQQQSDDGTSISANAPISFTLCDCSIFAIEKTVLCYRSQIELGILLELIVSNDNPFVARDVSIPLSPCIIDFQKIGGFPIQSDEILKDAYNSCYLYGILNFGGFSRSVFARPNINITDTAALLSTIGNNVSQYEEELVDINQRICILPGLFSMDQFKESLTSTTFSVQLHKEDVNRRAFHDRNIQEYINLCKVMPIDPIDSAPIAAKGKAPASAKGAPATATIVSSVTITDSDSFLLKCITRALHTSSQIKSHGVIKFRLEELLNSSVDLLRQFERLRNGGVANDDDDTVRVKEEMLLEVRMANPSKPDRVTRPSDISLRTALLNCQLQEQRKLDGTLQITSTIDTSFQETNNDNNNSNNNNTGISNTMSSTRNRTSGSAVGRVKPYVERFFECGTRITMAVELQRRLSIPKTVPSVLHSAITAADDAELKKLLCITPFTRMVLVLQYNDNDTLMKLNESIRKVNLNALPNIQGTLRSYAFTAEEYEASLKGTLDVITGFTMIDDEMRLIVIEGLAAPDGGMQSVFIDLPRSHENNSKLKILCNPEVLFPTRLYATFGPDLKRIRVRDKLRKLARKPEIYNRKQVDEVCFNAIDNAMSLRRSIDMYSTKEFDMYPTAESLNKLELLYGEAISRVDLDGSVVVEQAKAKAKQEKLAGSSSIGSIPIDGFPSTESLPVAAASTISSPEQKHSKSFTATVPVNAKLLPTNCHNEKYEEYLRSRPLHRVDYLAEHRDILKKTWDSTLNRMAHRDQQAHETLMKVLGPDATPDQKIYTYAQQALNFRVLNFTDMRERLGKAKNATYTFSQDFVSQTVCIVDEDVDRKKIAAEKRSHWLTNKGFVYPKPKTLKDLITHPKRPNDMRIEELQEPWMGDAAPANRNQNTPIEVIKLEQGYITQIRSGDLFGSLEPIGYQHAFELNLVGNRTKLPRGLSTKGMSQDPNAMRSIHLGGTDQARIIQVAADKEAADWKSKVVVDNLSIRVGGFKDRDTVLQFERTKDILDGEANRLSLKHLRTKKSVTGRDLHYETAPLSIMSTGPYVQNAATKALMRTSDRTKFITAKEIMKQTHDIAANTDGVNNTTVKHKQEQPRDFIRFINSDDNAAKILTVLSKRAIAPIDYARESVGPKWGSSPQV